MEPAKVIQGAIEKDQILYGAGDIFNWHNGINTVLVEKVDVVGFEPF
jgi:hypothetical protein